MAAIGAYFNDIGNGTFSTELEITENSKFDLKSLDRQRYNLILYNLISTIVRINYEIYKAS